MSRTLFDLSATQAKEQISSWACEVIRATINLSPEARDALDARGLGGLRGRDITIAFDLLQPTGELHEHTRQEKRFRVAGAISTRIATVSVLRVDDGGDTALRSVRIVTDAPDDDHPGKPLTIGYVLECTLDGSRTFRVVTWTQGDLEDFEQAYADQERERDSTSVVIPIE